MIVGIMSDMDNPAAVSTRDQIIEYLKGRGIDVAEYDLDYYEIKFMIAIGGDGTILRTANFLVQKRIDVPILGINRGTVGFLAAIHNEDWKPFLNLAIKECYYTEARTRIAIKVFRELDDHWKVIFADDALNEFHFGRKQSHVIKLHISGYEGELDLTSGDGYIFSTRTGSTAYNASANGQVITREDQFVITVICPIDKESYSKRVDNSIAYSFIAPPRNELVVEVDGEQKFALIPGDRVIVFKSEKKTRFMEFGD